jgi:hypothetical protein
MSLFFSISILSAVSLPLSLPATAFGKSDRNTPVKKGVLFHRRPRHPPTILEKQCNSLKMCGARQSQSTVIKKETGTRARDKEKKEEGPLGSVKRKQSKKFN